MAGKKKVKLSQLGQCSFGANGGRPLLAPSSATHLSPTRATLTRSAESWKILLAALLARTRVLLRVGGCRETREGEWR